MEQFGWLGFTKEHLVKTGKCLVPFITAAAWVSVMFKQLGLDFIFEKGGGCSARVLKAMKAFDSPDKYPWTPPTRHQAAGLKAYDVTGPAKWP